MKGGESNLPSNFLMECFFIPSEEALPNIVDENVRKLQRIPTWPGVGYTHGLLSSEPMAPPFGSQELADPMKIIIPPFFTR